MPFLMVACTDLCTARREGARLSLFSDGLFLLHLLFLQYPQP